MNVIRGAISLHTRQTRHVLVLLVPLLTISNGTIPAGLTPMVFPPTTPAPAAFPKGDFLMFWQKVVGEGKRGGGHKRLAGERERELVCGSSFGLAAAVEC